MALRFVLFTSLLRMSLKLGFDSRYHHLMLFIKLLLFRYLLKRWVLKLGGIVTSHWPPNPPLWERKWPVMRIMTATIKKVVVTFWLKLFLLIFKLLFRRCNHGNVRTLSANSSKWIQFFRLRILSAEPCQTSSRHREHSASHRAGRQRSSPRSFVHWLRSTVWVDSLVFVSINVSIWWDCMKQCWFSNTADAVGNAALWRGCLLCG